MRKFFISSHGKLASGFMSSLSILLGNVENVTVFDAFLDQRNVEDEINAFFEKLATDDQAILLSDIYGGSVNQVLYRHTNSENTFLITGINLALVLELVLKSDEMIDEIEIQRIIENARSEMRLCQLDDKKIEEDEFF